MLVAMISEELKREAGRLATELRNASIDEQPLAEDLSRPRPISTQLRQRFINLRQTLYAQGRYDPILGRFDSYTVEQATLDAIARRLEEIAGTGTAE